MTAEHWEHFHHQADIGVRGFGPTKEAAFAQTALALTGVITDPEEVKPQEMVPVVCEAPDDELLLADWLNALVYEMAHRKMLFHRFEVKMTGHRLQATMWGETVDVARHQPAVEIKGATYTELRVRPTEDGGWVAQCVVDV
ncbi:MAG: archease [Verrucomicrobia subdivision 3 bacterium]|nr:archease [Limisphaerales bacterium]